MMISCILTAGSSPEPSSTGQHKAVVMLRPVDGECGRGIYVLYFIFPYRHIKTPSSGQLTMDVNHDSNDHVVISNTLL